MKKLIYPILVLTGMFVCATAVHAQCANYQVHGFTCSGPNQCSQFLSLLDPYFGSVQYDSYQSTPCAAMCNTRITSWTAIAMKVPSTEAF